MKMCESNEKHLRKIIGKLKIRFDVIIILAISTTGVQNHYEALKVWKKDIFRGKWQNDRIRKPTQD